MYIIGTSYNLIIYDSRTFIINKVLTKHKRINLPRYPIHEEQNMSLTSTIRQNIYAQ
jgi:hypothetical protein